MPHRKVIAVASRGPNGGVSVSGLLRQALLNHGRGEHIYIATYEAQEEVEETLGGSEGPMDVRLVSIASSRWRGYNPGWSNTVLWGHVLAPHMPFELPDAATIFEWWAAYKSVNRRLAEYVVAALREPGNGDAVVVAHDYHMLRLARYVRDILEESGTSKVPPLGLFMHVPWPRAEYFTGCPNGKDVVEGMLCFDMIGFHTQGFADNFLATVVAYGLSPKPGQIRAIPISLDTAYFKQIQPQKPFPVPQKAPGCAVILAVERVEPVKGALERLRAFRMLLKKHRRFRGKVQLFQAGVNAADARLGIRAYQQFLAEVNDLGERINQRFGKPGYTPVCTLPWLSHAELSWVYRELADVLVVSSRTDGMNLVLQEAVAMGPKPPIFAPLLSKRTGAATMIDGDDGALLFDPLDRVAHKRALCAGLEMSPVERRRRVMGIRATVEAYTVHDWHRLLIEATTQQVASGG